MSDRSSSHPSRLNISRVPHLPGLDGMRALAVVAVMVYHANSGWLHGGFLGVEVFFVISGYLITLLLVAEHERDDSIDLKAFWIRRFRRLLPALYLMLVLVIVYLAVFFRQAQGRVRGDVIAGLTYVSNWFQIWVGAGYTASEAFAPLRHLWSLAVEEQFYLIWPLVMVAILRRGRAHLPRVALWLFGIAVFINVVIAVLFVPGDIDSVCTPDTMNGYWSIAGRCISINDTLYLSTVTRAGGLLLGAALAMVWRPVAVMRGPMRDKGRQLDLLALGGFVILAMLMWWVHLADPAENSLTGSQFDPWLFRGGLFLAGLATVMIITAVTHRGAITGRLLGNPVLSWVGTRSYGLYLFHWPIYQIIREQAGVKMSLGQFVLAMIITVPITELSYRLVEMPVRKGAIGRWMRREYRPRSAAQAEARKRLVVVGAVVAVLVGAAGVSVALAPNECVGEVECASEAGREAIDAAASTTLVPVETSAPTTVDPATVDPAPAGDTTVPGATTAPTTPPTEPPTTPPPPPPPPTAIGESVMLGAAPQLQAGGFVVNAAESRQGNATARVVGQLKASGQLGEIVVVQVGTNGQVDDAVYDEIMSYLPAAEHPKVIFLTVKANRNWIEGNNQRIWSLKGRYPNVDVLDWNGLVTSGQIQGISGDGVHLGTPGAKQTYANYIFGMIGRNDLIQPVG